MNQPPILVAAVRAVLLGIMVAGAVRLTWLATGPSTLDLVRTLSSSGASSSSASSRRGGPTVDVLVTDVAATLMLVAVSVLAAMLAASLAAVLLRDRADLLSALCARLTPTSCRRLAAAWCGLSLAVPLGLAAPAIAHDGARPHPCVRTCADGPSGLDGLILPDLPTGTGPGEPAGPVSTGAPSEGSTRPTVVVRRGDSLWTIASSRLPDGATIAEVASWTELLYRINRSTIGDDPDLILPGTALQLPSPQRSSRHHLHERPRL